MTVHSPLRKASERFALRGALTAGFLVFGWLSAPRPTVAQQPTAPSGQPAKPDWYFAVVGDSRDCGDLIMPKVAQSLKANSATPANFLWHLGDFRNGAHVDEDMKPSTVDLTTYHKTAWSDFIKRQITPIESIGVQVFLGIGNHEIIFPFWSHHSYQRAFAKWLDQEPIHGQRFADSERDPAIVPDDDHDDYHFFRNGIHFISLDNSDTHAVSLGTLVHPAFTKDQMTWLRQVLDTPGPDGAGARTVVVGMHVALPGSSVMAHAMDRTAGEASGQAVYKILSDFQRLGGAGQERHVYVLTSHAHVFRRDIFKNGHPGDVISGWVIGTGGAAQPPGESIQYGYVRFRVRSDGTLEDGFQEVTASSEPVPATDREKELTDFCFNRNHGEPVDRRR